MTAAAAIKNIVTSNSVVVFSKSFCGFCNLAKDVLQRAGQKHMYVLELDLNKDGSNIQKELTQITSVSTVPYIFINNKYIGGGTTIKSLYEEGKLEKILDEPKQKT